MTQLNVEFFHDVICSFCYPMSFRMRRVAEAIPELNIIHRSFALARTPDDLARMFGSHEAAKAEIMNHWDHANQNDTLHRFNIDGMKSKDFLFPTSMQPLRAAKAAYLIGGDNLYWNVFDALQKALFTDNLNINEEEVIESVVREVVEDYDAWKHSYDNDALQAVMKDFEVVNAYGIRSVPSLVVEGKYLINGALGEDYLIQVLKKQLAQKIESEKPKETLTQLNEDGESCNFVDGKWECD